MSQVFISYKKEDRPRVRRLVDALTAEGLSVWWDIQIEGGTAWRDAIQAQLDSAACVVVVWSRDAVGPEGHFVQDEAGRADRRGVYLPVTIDTVTPPLGFGHKQTISLVGWRGDRRDARFLDVLDAVRNLVAASEGAPTPAPVPRPRSRRWASPALAIAVAMAAALGVATIAIGPARLCSATRLSCPAWLTQARAPPNSVAVLPFANLSGDASQDYFSDGLSEEMLGQLAQIPGLRVVARTSSFKFRGDKEDSRTVAAKLGVAYILDGSVRRDGDLIRVSAQLVDARTGFERWSQTYDRSFKDIFTVQSDIAKAVAGALSVRLGGAELGRGSATNPEAYDDYLRGRRLADPSGDEASHRAALAKFDAAIAADSGFGAAYAARAETLLVIANRFTQTKDLRAIFDKAIASARRAVDLAPHLPEAHVALGDGLLYGARDFHAAKLAYEQALAVGGGGSSDVLVAYGQFQCEIGDATAGLIALQKAVTLDPLNAGAYRALGIALLDGGQYQQAISAFRRAIELSPGIASAHGGIGDALIMLGRPSEAQSEFALEPIEWHRLTGEAIALRRLGDQAGARNALERLISNWGDDNYQTAQIYAQWGEPDAAFAALDGALRAGDPGVEELRVDPLMTPLRADPRFAKTVARAGIGD